MSNRSTRTVSVFASSRMAVVAFALLAMNGCAVGTSEVVESTPEPIGNGPDVVRTAAPDEGASQAAADDAVGASAVSARLGGAGIVAALPSSYAGYDRAARAADRAPFRAIALNRGQITGGDTLPAPPSPPTADACSGEATDLLTDPSNCGRCGNVCLGVACHAGLCVSLTR